MLKVVVFCGGTGSVAFQNGLADLYGVDNIDLDIVVNAYDNGKSTGACRRILGNKILGPSDVRKNHLLQFSIQHKEEMQDTSSRYYRLYHLFDIRPSAPDAISYYEMAIKELNKYKDIFSENDYNYLCELLHFFFFQNDESGASKLRDTVKGEIFEDFSLSNIFYASCAAMNGDSLELASDRMVELLEIKNNVHLISDKNLILAAETSSGTIIDDEGEIVAWDNPNDKIVRAILLDNGREYIPSINENSHSGLHSIQRLTANADIIIFSSGTQWASLIPTYMHRGFAQMISDSRAKKYLIMNNIEDHDAVGVCAGELCEILEQYLHMDEITVVVNEYASQSMGCVPEKYRSISGRLSEKRSKKHDPRELVKKIMLDYYGEKLIYKYCFFDLDGTLWNERGTESEKKVGKENLKFFNGIIVTGNNCEHVINVLKSNVLQEKEICIFADYGNTHFILNKPNEISYLTDKYFLNDELVKYLEEVDEFHGKVTLRGNCIITIKPLDNREEYVALLNKKLCKYKYPVVANMAGKTSIDITHKDYTKAMMMKLILEKYKLSYSDVLFIGNELEDGSEKDIAEIGIETLQVNDVYECYIFLKTKSLIE